MFEPAPAAESAPLRDPAFVFYLLGAILLAAERTIKITAAVSTAAASPRFRS
jgi:hypothetical protein